MSLFKKKPGGTFLGNLLRTTVNKASGGLLGTGANMIPYTNGEGAVAATNYAAAVQNVAEVKNAVTSGLAGSPVVTKMVWSAIWQKYKFYFIGGALLLIILIVYLMKGKKNKFKRRY